MTESDRMTAEALPDAGATLFDGLFQVAYVTADLDAAVEAARARFGIRKMLRVRGIAHSPVTRINLALAWVGPWMIELIEPHGDGSSVYEALAVADGAPMRLHHFGHLLECDEAWSAMHARIAASGQPIFVERDKGGIRFLFVDTRPTLGCFTEHMICTPEGRAMLEGVPRN